MRDFWNKDILEDTSGLDIIGVRVLDHAQYRLPPYRVRFTPRLREIGSPTVLASFEKKIEDLENQKLVIADRLAQSDDS